MHYGGILHDITQCVRLLPGHEEHGDHKNGEEQQYHLDLHQHHPDQGPGENPSGQYGRDWCENTMYPLNFIMERETNKFEQVKYAFSKII